jgi:hypothetical protein
MSLLLPDQERVASVWSDLVSLISGEDMLDLTKLAKDPDPTAVNTAMVLRQLFREQVRILVATEVLDAMGDAQSRDAIIGMLLAAGHVLKKKGDAGSLKWQIKPAKDARRRYFYVFADGFQDQFSMDASDNP